MKFIDFTSMFTDAEILLMHYSWQSIKAAIENDVLVQDLRCLPGQDISENGLKEFLHRVFSVMEKQQLTESDKAALNSIKLFLYEQGDLQNEVE